MSSNISPNTNTNIENLVFSGGALGGISFVGVLLALEETNMLPKVKRYAGCSIGSIFATLISLGYSSDELSTIVKHFRFADLMDLQILGILDNFGLETGRHIMDLIDTLIKRKTCGRKLTFNDHWRITGRTLCINASCLATDKCEYYSTINTPDMSILEAIRRSIAIPPLMSPVISNNTIYVDGGLHDPFPIKQFSPYKTLGFRLCNNNEAPSDINPFIIYICSIIGSLSKRLRESYNHDIKNHYKVVDINTGISTLKVDIRRRERNRLMRIGYCATMDYLKNEIIKI